MGWLRKLFGKSETIYTRPDVSDFNSKMSAVKKAGDVDGKHYTDSVESVKQLKREGKNQEAIAILLRLVDATEAEAVEAAKESSAMVTLLRSSVPTADKAANQLRSAVGDFWEASSAEQVWGVAPWYYEQLAILYRKEKQYLQEVAILERYINQPKAAGVGPQKLAGRLEKAKELLAKK